MERRRAHHLRLLQLRSQQFRLSRTNELETQVPATRDTASRNGSTINRLTIMKTICLVVQSVYDFDPRVRRKAEALVSCPGIRSTYWRCAQPTAERHPQRRERLHALARQDAGLAGENARCAAFFVWTFIRAPLLMRRHCAIDVNTLPDFLIFAPMLARWMGARLVLDMHEITPEFYMSKYGISSRSRLIRLITWLERVSFNFADHVITINEPILDLLVSRGLVASKSTVLMNAVDEGAFASASTAARPETPAGESFIMMYHGTLTRTYGLDIAVEAFALAHQECPAPRCGSSVRRTTVLWDRLANADWGRRSKDGQVARPRFWVAELVRHGDSPFRRDVSQFGFQQAARVHRHGQGGRDFPLEGDPPFQRRRARHFEPNDPSDLAMQMVRVYHDRALRSPRRMRAREHAGFGGMSERAVSRPGRPARHRFGAAPPRRSAPPGRPSGLHA